MGEHWCVQQFLTEIEVGKNNEKIKESFEYLLNWVLNDPFCYNGVLSAFLYFSPPFDFFE